MFYRLPSWHVCCKESSSASSYYSQDDNCALENEDVQSQKKDERGGPVNAELSGKVGSSLPVPPEENKLKDDYIVNVQKQDTESKKLSPSVTETLPTVDVHEDSSSVVVDSENTENISSSSTSEITPISKLE